MKTALAFSGGKDSWACLWLYKDKLSEIQVIWVDTGKNYPEILESIELAKKMCPHFVTLTVDRDGQNAFHGIPADVVPISWTREGHESSGVKEAYIQSYLHCCFENISLNIMKYCQQVGITELICGQRNEEHHKSPSRDGDVVFGIKRIQPIEQWPAEQVLMFLKEHMEFPEHFKFKHSSMDCYDCTAYLKETKDIQAYRKVRWPELDKKYNKRKALLDKALRSEVVICMETQLQTTI